MSSETPLAASEESKTALENSISWFLTDKLGDPSATIATKKYLTNDNLLVYLTRCEVAEVSVPHYKVQVFQRVENGVRETGYQLFGDHRFEKYDNAMIFGTAPETAHAEGSVTVTDTECRQILTLVNSLQTARQTG